MFITQGNISMQGDAVRGTTRRICHDDDRTEGSHGAASRPSIGATSTRSRSRTRTALVVTCFAVLLGACSLGTSQQYISSENDDLDFALPNEFRDVGIVGEGLEWTRAYTTDPVDGAEDAPLIRATVVPLTEALRDTMDLQNLRLLLLGDRDPLEDADDLHLVRHEPWVDQFGNEGNRLQVDVLDPVNGDVTFAHFVALDANRTRVAQVQVACSTQCFVANIDTIDAILDSVRFTP